MLWNILAWALLGALAGWLASKIMKTRGGLVRNIIIGIIGAGVGGFLAPLIGISTAAFSLGGLLVAVAGACLCLFVAKLLFK